MTKKPKLTVLVTGGRGYNNYKIVSDNLERLEKDHTLFVVQGGARGADTLALMWCESHGVFGATVHAKWDIYGKAAGTIRNQHMLDAYKPDLILAFPGGKGTEDMISRAERAGVKVERVSDQE